MNDHELLCAARMRLQGKSWEEIGKLLAYDPSYVRRVLKNRLFREGSGEAVVYPNVRQVIDAQYSGSISRFAQALGVSRQAMHQMLTGEIPISRNVLHSITAATGMQEADILERSEQEDDL